MSDTLKKGRFGFKKTTWWLLVLSWTILLDSFCVYSLTNNAPKKSSIHNGSSGNGSRRLFMDEILKNTVSLSFLAVSTTTTTAATMISSSSPALALDMDAFANSQLSTTNAVAKPMSEDEALCRFGSASKEVGNACVRAGLPTKRKDNLDAFGNVDRGDFVRCKIVYEDKGDHYERKTVCQ